MKNTTSPINPRTNFHIPQYESMYGRWQQSTVIILSIGHGFEWIRIGFRTSAVSSRRLSIMFFGRDRDNDTIYTRVNWNMGLYEYITRVIKSGRLFDTLIRLWEVNSTW